MRLIHVLFLITKMLQPERAFKFLRTLQQSILLWGSLSFISSVAYGLESNLQQGGFYIGKATSGTKVLYKEKIIRTGKAGHFIIGFGRDAALDQEFTLVDAQGNRQKFQLRLSPRAYPIQKIKGVDKKYVTPPDNVLNRIKGDNRKVKAARQFDSDNEDFFQGLSSPADGPVTGVYGSQRFFNGEPRRPHFGLDVAGPVGAKVTAVADGVVRMADPDLYFSGGTIVVDHGFGVSSSYLHLSNITVKVGEVIQRGQEIGKIGATGRVTGPHLDWRLNWFDVRMDPQLMLKP